MTFRGKHYAHTLWLAAGLAVVSAQQPPATPQAPAGTGAVVGSVVDAATGQGVPDARIAVQGIPSSSQPSGRPTYLQAITDERGRFAFTDLPVGRLAFQATKAGYSREFAGGTVDVGAARPQFDLAAGDTLTGVVVRLVRNGVVSGRVLDGSGEPLASVRVSVARAGTFAGRAAIDYGSRPTMTNDLGEYRISDVPPGEYVVVLLSAAASLPVPRDESRPMPAPEMQLRMALPYSASARPVLFFPGVTSSADAARVMLRPAEVRAGVDFRVERGATWSVSGTVANRPAGDARFVYLWLRPDDPRRLLNPLDQRSAAADASGRFTFPGVPPGRYKIQTIVIPEFPDEMYRYNQLGTGGEILVPVGRPSLLPLPAALWAETTVSVQDTNIDGVVITLRPGARIRGQLVFDGNSAKPSAEQLAATPVAAEAVDGQRFDALPGGGVHSDGTFETAGLPPGRYHLMLLGGAQRGAQAFVRLSASVPQWFQTSTEIEGVSSTGRPIDVGTSDVHVVLKFSDREARLAGTVRDDTGRAAAYATVYLFPTDRETWTNTQYGSIAFELGSTRSGGYQTPLRPGEYFAAAVATPLGDTWRRIEVLDALSKTAKTIKIGVGQAASLDLVVAKGR